MTGSSKKWKTIATVGRTPTSYKLTSLSRSKTYYIRVAAENEEGVGEWRELTEAVTPKKPKSEYTTYVHVYRLESVYTLLCVAKKLNSEPVPLVSHPTVVAVMDSRSLPSPLLKGAANLEIKCYMCSY